MTGIREILRNGDSDRRWKSRHSRGIKRKKREQRVDVEEYTRQINNACYKLWRRGYEVVSITPLISGSADLIIKSEGSAGWGYSYTEGVVVLARKIREANAAE